MRNKGFLIKTAIAWDLVAACMIWFLKDKIGLGAELALVVIAAIAVMSLVTVVAIDRFMSQKK